ncbi:MAG: DNA translocase FtsK, partial [Clostridia bacterium]|nr:DNA translocase FtsK [Clostridia bacterium]
MDEALFPMPDGSEIAETPPDAREDGDILSKKIPIDAGDEELDAFMRDNDLVSLINEQTKDVVVNIPHEEEPDEADVPDMPPIAKPAPPQDVAPRQMPPIAKPAPPIAKPAPSYEAFGFSSESAKGAKPANPTGDDAPEPMPYVYPPVELLAASKPAKIQNQAEHDIEKGKKLIETLASFNISARMIGVAHGPTVTRFELVPAPGVKVSRITALSDDIALNLAAISVRIEAPIPGKSAVGVEVPNDNVEIVPLRDVLESQECRKATSRLAIALGRDNAGRYIIADLAKMPHVLIAGQTGSGKSVCINCIICSILYRSTPEEVRLIMIDPKVVELSCYNGIPHLLVPVVSDPKKASGALQWAVKEMTDRYDKFANLGVRDIKGYNAHRPEDAPFMPQIVIIIDELADLMMVVPGEVEDSICRLAQLARAAGIHLVIATQRPSVNVITGVIKANIPSRIAFTVTSQVDSRTILDGSGAEKLLGRGDMLYAPGNAGKTRVQGAWVSDDEVHAIVDFIKVRTEASYDGDMIEKIESSGKSDAEKKELLDEFDELLPEAVEMVVQAEQASVSMLQRRLRVGHSRAGRLIDEMEVRGIIGPDEGSKSRKVLITREQFRAMFKEG